MVGDNDCFEGSVIHPPPGIGVRTIENARPSVALATWFEILECAVFCKISVV